MFEDSSMQVCYQHGESLNIVAETGKTDCDDGNW